MKREYLGDSYDAVKKLWGDILNEWAPLYAERQFIPDEMREEFTRLTKIPLLSALPRKPFSILNDPDTGIRLPGEKNQNEGRTHISIPTIAEQLKTDGIRCVITFDQSNYRTGKGSKVEQRRAKMTELHRRGFKSMYYVSHAPFCFALPNDQAFLDLKCIFDKAGIPPARLEEI
jgi:hypothetical protein